VATESGNIIFGGYDISSGNGHNGVALRTHKVIQGGDNGHVHL
jgi:hypothetical protein